MLNLIYQRDSEVNVHHDVNKAQVFYLFRNNAKYEITISLQKKDLWQKGLN